MASLNKVMLIGNLGQDPELRHTATGKSVCNFTVATTEKWTDDEGEPHQRVDWHKVVIWNNLADNINKYGAKGRQVYVEGKSITRSWEDKDGNKRYTTEVSASVVYILGNKDDAKQSSKEINQQKVDLERKQKQAVPKEDLPIYSEVKKDDEYPF